MSAQATPPEHRLTEGERRIMMILGKMSSSFAFGDPGEMVAALALAADGAATGKVRQPEVIMAEARKAAAKPTIVMPR